jgi:hypothetical protein
LLLLYNCDARHLMPLLRVLCMVAFAHLTGSPMMGYHLHVRMR